MPGAYQRRDQLCAEAIRNSLPDWCYPPVCEMANNIWNGKHGYFSKLVMPNILGNNLMTLSAQRDYIEIVLWVVAVMMILGSLLSTVLTPQRIRAGQFSCLDGVHHCVSSFYLWAMGCFISSILITVSGFPFVSAGIYAALQIVFFSTRWVLPQNSLVLRFTTFTPGLPTKFPLWIFSKTIKWLAKATLTTFFIHGNPQKERPFWQSGYCLGNAGQKGRILKGFTAVT